MTQERQPIDFQQYRAKKYLGNMANILEQTMDDGWTRGSGMSDIQKAVRNISTFRKLLSQNKLEIIITSPGERITTYPYPQTQGAIPVNIDSGLLNEKFQDLGERQADTLGMFMEFVTHIVYQYQKDRKSETAAQ